MIRPDELRVVLKRLDGEPAEALESDHLEFKRWEQSAGNAAWRMLREVAVSFANADGGTMVLGVNDQRRTRAEALEGVGELDLDQVRRAIHSGTEPAILADVQEVFEDGKRLLIVNIPRGVPPHTTTEGMAKIRVGKECRPLTGSQLSGMLIRGGRRDLSAEPLPGASIRDLDPGQIKTLQRALETEGGKPELARMEPVQVLQSLGLLRGEEMTMAAILLLGSPAALARWMPQHEVIFLRFRKKETEYTKRQNLRGPLLSVLDAVQNLLEAHLQLQLTATAGFGELALPDLTWNAAREAVLNAVLHRDYFQHQSVFIRLHEDRLEVSNPGGFMPGITPENILRHPPLRRNSLLADVFESTGLVNRAGLGVDRLYEQLLRLGKSLPRYEATESSVTVKLPLKSDEAFARFVSREDREGRRLELDDLIVLRTVVDRGQIDRWEGSRKLQLTEEQAAERLASLHRRQYLIARGRGRSTVYRLARRHSDLLHGTMQTNVDLPLDDEAVRLRSLALLQERGKLTNAGVRQISGFSRKEALRLLSGLVNEQLIEVRGRGRAAHYVLGARARKRK